MPPDLDVHQLLLEHDALGSFDGADYVRLDAVWRVPHDGSAPRLLGPWRAWATSTLARVIAAERQLLEQAQMISDRDALIVHLQQQLADATRVPPAVAASATGMDTDRAAPPALGVATGCAPPPVPAPDLLPCSICGASYPGRRSLSTHVWRRHHITLRDYETQPPPVLAARVAEPVAPFDLAVAMHASPNDKRRRAHQGPAAPPLELPPGTAHEYEHEPARWRCPKCGRDAFTKHPSRDWCLDCAAKLPRAA